MRIGAHMSAAGGAARAAERAVLHECEALQLFTKNNARWVGKPLADDDVRRFREIVGRAGLRPAVAHASYLINLAAPAGAFRERSIVALVDELERASLLGLDGVVIHPGVASTESTEDQALTLVAEAVCEAFTRHSGDVPILLEHTAGQGRSIGYRFEHLAAILDQVGRPDRVGVCVDTCHLLAAGYDMTTEAGYDEVIRQFDRTVGLHQLRILHANDSKRPVGSRVDRHEHIGQGYVGLEPFRRLLHDRRLAHLAMVIETSKTPGICDSPRGAVFDPLDAMNLERLRGLRDAPG